MTEEITLSALSILEEKGQNNCIKNSDKTVFFARQIYHISKIISDDGQGIENRK